MKITAFIGVLVVLFGPASVYSQTSAGHGGAGSGGSTQQQNQTAPSSNVSCDKFATYDDPNESWKKGAIDLRSQLGPVRDQDSIGYCFAFAGADLYEQWLVKNKQIPMRDPQKNYISGMGLGLNYTKSGWRSNNGIFSAMGETKKFLLPKINANDESIRIKYQELGQANQQLRDKLEANVVKHPEYKRLQELMNKKAEISKTFPENDYNYTNPDYDKTVKDMMDLKKHIQTDIQMDDKYRDETSDIVKRISTLNAEINHLEKENTQYRSFLYPKDDLLPQGGWTKNALEEHYPGCNYQLEKQFPGEEYTSNVPVIVWDEHSNSISCCLHKDKMKCKKNLGKVTDFLLDTNLFDNYGKQTLNSKSCELIKKNKECSQTSSICLESEISSMDNGYSAMLSKKNPQELLLYYPNNIKNTLGFLNEARYNSDIFKNNQCLTSDLMNGMFPGAQLGGLNELDLFLSSLKEEDVLVEKLLERSCKEKNLPEPRIVGTTVPSNISKADNSVLGNELLIKQIDDGLEKGLVAEVSYHSKILYGGELDPSASDYHSSVIVGKTSICNQDYYILRNSWGRGACEMISKTYTPLPDKKAAADIVDNKNYECLTNASNTAKGLFPDCTDNTCWENREKKRSEMTKVCDAVYRKEKVRAVDQPYFCDQEGNFIVSKEQMKRGLYGVATIAN